jgi:hypothetical protein
MSFAKNVHRYYKYILGSIVAVMALSLVISGNVTPASARAGQQVATIFGTLPVTEGEWREALSRAGAYFRWAKVEEFGLRDPQRLEFLFRPQRGGPGLLASHPMFSPDQEQIQESARRLIILKADARTKGVRVTEEEITAQIDRLFTLSNSGRDVDSQMQFTRNYFFCDPATFREVVRDGLLIGKSIRLDIDGANIRYATLFEEQLGSSKSIRVLVAGFDPERIPGGLPEVLPEEILREFEARRDGYKMPEKIQIEYLMADFAEFKGRIKDATPTEIEKYYNDNKREFIKASGPPEGHHEGDGHDHGAPKEEYKKLEEVREEIIRKIREKQASDQAYVLMNSINSRDVADEFTKLTQEEKAKEPKDDKSVRARVLARTNAMFTLIRDKYKAQGIGLANDLTFPFDRHHLEPLEQAVGKPAGGSNPVDWMFSNPVGEVANRLHRTDKGISLFRIAHKVEGYDSDLTEPIREKISKELAQNRRKGRAARLAQELSVQIRETGEAAVAKLRARLDCEIQRSIHFNSKGTDSIGIEPAGLAQQVRTFASSPDSSKLYGAQVIAGDQVGGDRGSWSFLVVVDDIAQAAPDFNPEEFRRQVKEREDEEHDRLYKARMDQVVQIAEWKATEKPKEE